MAKSAGIIYSTREAAEKALRNHPPVYEINVIKYTPMHNDNAESKAYIIRPRKDS